MLTGIGKHRDLQRVIVPYAKLLGVLNEVPDSQEDMVL